MEKAAASILTRAVKFDEAKRYTEALVCYQEGLQLLVDNLKDIPPGDKKNAMKEKVRSYIERAERIKTLVNEKKEAGSYHEEIQIQDDSKGHSYEAVMGRFMDCNVEKINIEDPYIRNFNQICNLVHFCELAVRKCQNLKTIYLKTSYDQKNQNEQKAHLDLLSEDLLLNHEVNFQLEYSPTLHDRRIILSNGWIIKIGRGLDYFKPPVSKMGLGRFDLNFRPCRETKVDIYHQKTTNNLLI